MPPAARGGGGSGAVRAGRAFVELFANDNKLYRSLDAAQARLKQFGAFAAKIGLTGTAAGGAALAPLAKTLTDAVTRGAKIDQLAKRFGTTTTEVSALAYAFETAGVTLEEFEGTIDGVRSKITAAADANEDVIQGLASFRTNGRRLIDMPLEKQLDHLADAFTRITRESDQAEQAQSLFGASGLKMLEVIKRGSSALAERKAKAGPGGGLVSQEDATRSTNLLRAYTEAWQGVKYTVLEVGAALLPLGDGVGEASGKITTMLAGVRSWIDDNRETIQTTAKVAAVVTAGGVALVAFGAIISATGVVLGAVVLPLKLVAAGVLAVGAAVGVAKVAVVGFFPELLLLAGIGATLVGVFADDLPAGFKSFAKDAGEAWDSVTAALGRGDIGAAARVGLALVTLEWAKATAYWTSAWNAFKSEFVDGWRDLYHAIAGGWAEIGEALDILPEGTRNTIDAMRREQQQASNRARAADLKAAEEQLRMAQQKFDLANQAARGGDWVKAWGDLAAAGVGKAIKGVPAAARIQSAPRVPSQQELFNAVKGTFVLANARMQLGYGDQAQKRQLDAAVSTAKNTAVLPEIRDAIRDNKPKFQ